MADTKIIVNPALPENVFMVVQQDGDGIEVATQDGVLFFSWEEVLELDLQMIEKN